MTKYRDSSMTRPGLFRGENPRAEVMAWMDYADHLEAIIARDQRELMEAEHQLRIEREKAPTEAGA